ncbi:MAG: malate dehydrogenase [Euryarchaeota archaeon CG01_land_8_20_14_3_00_38_12]|nr:MAG: malate dehydrogenase [Euryarchaeota archaeon CG01_land_8_20_14_3_00_38_12]
MKKPTVKELLAKAEKPGKDAMKLHPFYHGKIEVVPKCIIRNFEDFGIWYTPGVAQPCRAIKENKNLVYDMTNKWNNVAVVSDGTRVLGLGDIGPEAGLPVMEGKALLFKYLGGVDAFPVCLNTKDADEIIRTVKILQPSFGGINLEDIEQPKCFRILETLRKECEIPVWHDDQQGTAAIILAGLINAVKIVGKKLDEIQVAMIGAGAANICAARIMMVAGVKPGNLVMVDSKGILNPQRTELKENYREKWEMCIKTNSEQKSGDAADAMKNADVCIAASKPGPGTIKLEWVKDMADDSIVFACANPVPEIWPWEAKEAGVRIFATGRSDFPNQVNNSLGFPGIFRGTLDVRAKTITDEMCVEAAKALAECAEDKGLREDYIIPDMDDWEVFPREAVAVAMKAMEQGVARKKLSRNEEYENAMSIIKRARDTARMLMEKGFIKPAPE